MAKAYRIPEKQSQRLERLAEQLGLSQAQVLKLAIDYYYELELGSSKRTALDRLIESGFQPHDGKLELSAEDEAAQTKFIRAKLGNKRRD